MRPSCWPVRELLRSSAFDSGHTRFFASSHLRFFGIAASLLWWVVVMLLSADNLDSQISFLKPILLLEVSARFLLQACL